MYIFTTHLMTGRKIPQSPLLSGTIMFRDFATHRKHAERVDWVSMLEVEE